MPSTINQSELVSGADTFVVRRVGRGDTFVGWADGHHACMVGLVGESHQVRYGIWWDSFHSAHPTALFDHQWLRLFALFLSATLIAIGA